MASANLPSTDPRHQQLCAALLARGVAIAPDHLHFFETIDSTNRALWPLAKPGQTSLAIALAQSAGRGQWGRVWQSPPGGIYFSLYCEPELLPAHAEHLTLAVAWGLATALRAAIAQSMPQSLAPPPIPLQIKWPNDLLLAERKLGGILSEIRWAQGRLARAVVGVGINWANPVPEMGIALHAWLAEQDLGAAGLAQMGWAAGVAIAVEGVLAGLACLQRQGIGGFLADYLALLANSSQAIVLASDLDPGHSPGKTDRG